MSLEKSSIIVIPDVHGRVFWKKVINSNLPIVFLGDYLDPYYWEHISFDNAMDNFKEIIEFKKKHKDQVTLLLGNHDAHYVGLSPDYCRMSFMHASKAFELYNQNKDLFQFAYKWNNTLFTHAGVNTKWLAENKIPENVDKVVDLLNFQKIFTFEYVLDAAISGMGSQNFSICQIGRSRGGDSPYGSPIWGNISEMGLYPAFKDSIIQIFGHSQLEETGSFIHEDNWYMCDSRDVFIWDGKELKNFLAN